MAIVPPSDHDDAITPIQSQESIAPSLNSVPTDLIRIVMKLLDVRDLLRLASCSTIMRRSADSDQLWKHIPPFKILWHRETKPYELNIGQRIASSNLRVRIALQWSAVYYSTTTAADPIIDAIFHLPRLVDLHLDCGVLKVDQWMRIFSHESLHSLTNLSLGRPGRRDISVGFVGAVAQLPLIRRLSINSYIPSEDTLESLSQMSQLTSLKCGQLVVAWLHGQVTYDRAYRRFHSIAKCTSLKELTLFGFVPEDEQFLEFFTSNNLTKLEKLDLTPFRFHNTPEHFAATLSRMTHLHELRLSSVEGLHLFLPSLAAAPVLNSVFICCEASEWDALHPSPKDVTDTLLQTSVSPFQMITVLTVHIQGEGSKYEFQSRLPRLVIHTVYVAR